MSATATEPTKRTRNKYTDEQIAGVLAKLEANNGNIYLTSKQESVPYHTLREWAVNRRRASPAVEALQQVKTGTLASKLHQVAHLSLDRLVDPDVIGKASPLDCAKIAGIAIDKGLVLAGLVLGDDGREIKRQDLAVTLHAALAELAEMHGGELPLDPLDHARNITPQDGDRPQDIVLFQG